MTYRKGSTIELEIDKMAFGGKGIARVDGFVIFVQGGVPGDRVRARIYKKKKGYAEARIEAVLAASPDRIQPPCPYSGFCGGCQLQHVRYERQLYYKREQVKEALKHIGGLTAVTVQHPLPSRDIFAYRNKMEFSFSDRPWVLPQEMDSGRAKNGFALGLHAPGTYHKVIDVAACMLHPPQGNQILREVRTFVKDSRIPVYGLKSHEGFWRFLTVRYSRAFDEWLVNVVTSEERPEILHDLATTLCSRIHRIKTVVNNINERRASIAVGQRETILFGQGLLKDTIGPFTFHISANSFFQTNSRAAEALYQTVVRYAELKGTDTVLDLYSGTGTIPIFLAEKARAVTGIEINHRAVADAFKNCKENGIDNCHFICADIGEGFSAITTSPDVLIIDPPRAGLHKDVLAQILSLAPSRIIYISCNPTTLARDLAQMHQDYALVEVQPVDMFPHTYHIEVVGKLCLRKK